MTAAGTIAERVERVVVEQLGLGAGQYSPSASFMVDLGADSLDAFELALSVEEEFGVEVDDDTLESWKTPADMVAWLEARQKAWLEARQKAEE